MTDKPDQKPAATEDKVVKFNSTIINFKRPIQFDGREIEKIELDLESLTGRDISQVKREWAQGGNFNPMPATDLDFCILIAARTSKQPIEFFEDLPAGEWLKVAQEVSNFLMTSG